MLLSTIVVSAVTVGVVGDAGSFPKSTGTQLVFSDDFDDGTLNKWTLSGWNPCGLLEVTNSVSHSSPYSMHAQSDPGTNTGPYVIKHFGTEYPKIKIETWFYLPVKNQEYDQFAIIKPGTWNDVPGEPVWDYNFVVMLRDDDYSVDLIEVTWDTNDVKTIHVRGTDLYDLSPQSWHQVDVEMTESQVIVTIDGNVIFDDVRFDDLPIDCFAMGDTKGSSGSWGDAYWDDVKVWEISENDTVDLSIFDEDITFSDPSPQTGETVAIEAIVHNEGSSPSQPIDWKVCGEFHLTYRSHPDGNEWARPIWIGDNNSFIGVKAYGGYSSINGKKDTIEIKTSGYGPHLPPIYPEDYFKGDVCYYFSPSGGSGYYDDGYYVEFWYQSSDNKFYGMICDAANHNNIYATGSIEAKDFSFSDISIGRCLGTDSTGWNGIPVIYEGWVDNVEFYWSEDGISGYEYSVNYDFTTANDFTKVDEQTYSNVYWDSSNENVFFHADRRDPWDSGERMEQGLPTPLTNIIETTIVNATCTVSFYLDNVSPENLIHQEFNVFVPGGGETTVYADWTPAVAGNHDIIVVVSDVDPEDCDLSNNTASKFIHVESGLEVDLSITEQDIGLQQDPTQGVPVMIEATVHGDLGTGGGWQKYGMILDLGGVGEDLQIADPSVLKMPNGNYVMWYTGDGDDGLTYRHRIFRATSPDGLNWQREGLILDYGGSYQQYGVLCPYVMIDGNGTYHMWYTGIGYSGGYRAYIHRAISTDGITWQKLGLELNYGSSADPDGVRAPFVHYDGTQWHMWYGGIDWGSPNEVRICHAHKATLSDPWIKDGVVLNNNGPYDYPSAAFPHVRPTATGYEMFYTGYTPYTGPSRVLHATSPDGLSWTRTGIEFEGSLPLETNSVGMADVSLEGDTYKAWYAGYDGSTQRLFYAEKVPAEPGLDATCTVSFYLDSIMEENLIDRVENVFVPADGETPVSINWMPVAGIHTLIVEVSNVNPPDSDLSNNIASKEIYVQDPSTATATGPQGAHHDPVITITYDWTGTPTAVDIFYSTNTGDSWNYLGTDASVDGFYDWTPEANPGPKPSKYYWIANAQNGADDVGIPANGTAPEAGPFNWKTWDICDEGARSFSVENDNWHFVSIPLDVSGDVLTVFDDVNWGDGGTTWDYIQWYDASDSTWRSYSIYKPPELNDMPFVNNMMGIWIHLTGNDGDGVLTVGEGTEPVSTTISLHAGWNLVGYPSLSTRTVADALVGTGADRVEVFDSASPYRIKKVDPTYVMKPGEGYWIHVPADTVWTVDW